MASIALFHSVLGVRPGVEDAAARLRAHGHEVLVVDQYDGQSFDDYATAIAFQEEVGFPALMQGALDATADLPDGFVVAGFSNGAGMAEHVALQRPVAAAVLFSGALPLPFLGADAWPSTVPVQLHYAVSDPKRNQDWVDQFLAAVRASGGTPSSTSTPGPDTCSPTPPGPTSSTSAPRRCCGPTCSTSSGTSHEPPGGAGRAKRRSALHVRAVEPSSGQSGHAADRESSLRPITRRKAPRDRRLLAPCSAPGTFTARALEVPHPTSRGAPRVPSPLDPPQRLPGRSPDERSARGRP